MQKKLQSRWEETNKKSFQSKFLENMGKLSITACFVDIKRYHKLSQNITVILVRDFTKVIHEKFACLFTCFGRNEVSINN